jgi:cytochrome b561
VPYDETTTGAVDPEQAGYGTVARVFHWVMALLILVQIPIGVAMLSQPLSQFSNSLFVFHKGGGAVLLVLVFARLCWRLGHRPPPFPDFVPPPERSIASATHHTLYVLLLVMVISGYVRTVGDGYPIELLDMLGVPPLMPLMPQAAEFALVVHQFASMALVALVAVHVSAVLRHQLVDRHAILARMWPPHDKRHSSVDSSKPGGK